MNRPYKINSKNLNKSRKRLVIFNIALIKCVTTLGLFSIRAYLNIRLPSNKKLGNVS